MTITYSGRSALSAQKIAGTANDIALNRGSRGDINWGRARADTELNPDISNSTNKRVMRELFAANDVPMPKLIDPYLAFAWSDTPVVGRPDTHTRGRGFWLCRSALDVSRALAGTRKKKAATHFMDYIDADHEYRVHIFKGKSIRISEKKFDAEHGYTTIKPTGEIKHVRKAAKKAVKALGLDFGAVDILATDSAAWVLEVNAAPGLGGTMPKLYADAFKEWYEGRE